MAVNRLLAVYVILAFCAAGISVPTGFAQAMAQPKSELARPPESSHIFKAPLVVDVFDYTQISRRTLEQVEQVASGIFAQAGVNLVWVDCAVAGKPQPDPECNAPVGSSWLGVRIVPRIPLMKGIAGAATAGYTAGDYITVSLNWAETVSAYSPDFVPDFLGSVIAHELGHALLGPHSHSASGLMGARWSIEQLQEATQHTLSFAPQQAARIRAEVMARALPLAEPATALAMSGK